MLLNGSAVGKLMGKVRQKSHKPDEHLLGLLRENKKEIKRLNQKVKQLEKDLSYKQTKSNERSKRVKEDDYDCPNCGKGILRESDIGIRKIINCSLCDYQKVIKL